MSTPARSTIVLRARRTSPLADEKVRAIVEATAWAIGERTGVTVVSVTAKPDHVRLVLECSSLTSIGFAAELRRLTERWYARKYPQSDGKLWAGGEVERDGADLDQGTWRSEHEDDDEWWRGGEHDLGPPG